MKILIVDDEALVRVGMKTIVHWEKHGYELVGEAANGIEALRLARIHKPDIILVDIIMPEMNGLEFIKDIKNELPESAFIIMSCHNEVYYYKEAIKLGVIEYIQKSSITPDEILKIVDKASQKLSRRRVFDADEKGEKLYINTNLVLTEFINQVIKGHIKDPLQIEKKLISYGINLKSHGFYIMAFCARLEDSSNEKYEGNFNHLIINMCQEIINDTSKGYVFENYNDIITVIIANSSNDNRETFIKNFFNRIEGNVMQCLDTSLTAGVSLELYEYEDIKEGYLQAFSALQRKFFEGLRKVIFYDGKLKEQETMIDIDREKKVALSIQSPFEVEAFLKANQNIMEYLASSHGISLKYVIDVNTEILYHIIAILDKNGISIKDVMEEEFSPREYLESATDLVHLNKKMIEVINKNKYYYNTKFNKKGLDFIYSIRQYIIEHISERITLEAISNAVYLSPSYICRIYKKETGTNIQDFILKAKIEKCKEMLCQGYNINEIVDAVGFSSDNYLIKVFKDYTSLTPKQYKKQVVNQMSTEV